MPGVRPSTKIETRKVAVVSTAHCTAGDGILMLQHGTTRMQHPSGAGAVFFLPTEFHRSIAIQLLEHEGFSAEFCRIIETLALRGFDWVYFDADGPKYTEFPTFEW